LTSTGTELALRTVVAPAVAQLMQTPGTAGHLMLVGAICRDTLHAEQGHTSVLRRTHDLDLALAVDDWDVYERLTKSLPPCGTASNIRFRVAGAPVDIVPFGGVESPDGEIPPMRDADPMNVFGFRDVWNDATTLTLDDGLNVRLPSIAGYTVLKLSAWAHRSQVGEFKDGSDLACPIYWYESSDHHRERLYTEPRGQHALSLEWDTSGATSLDASTLLLAGDAMALLTQAHRAELVARWELVEDDLLATYMDNDSLEKWPRRTNPLLAQYARSIRTGLTLANGNDMDEA